ncbi:MAG: hypothetical protein QF793_01105 [Candidatus Peribacteraceae bacterium]|mgnify:FL=1|nr:hypothetical protein [bacterium]MDP6561501.1 hypothetical protein [Candidatus Peribacteraceae bacterium]|tara:strand:- start:15960 stop:16220 length:261 start_codon:yes stop_codon:yes gene_type:complete
MSLPQVVCLQNKLAKLMGLSDRQVPTEIQKRFSLEDCTPDAFWIEYQRRGRRGKGHMEQAVDRALAGKKKPDPVPGHVSRPYSHGW